MGGGLMQLVAIGAQDVYITGNPQITFFKFIYKRHTNYAIESIEQSYNGEADFGKKISVVIGRNGDLLGQIMLELDVGININSTDTNSDLVGDYKWSVKDSDFQGWLLCDGRFLDKREYVRLFNKIGYKFGLDLSNNNLFRIPDLRGKTAAGINDGFGGLYEQFNSNTINLSNSTFTLQNNVDKWLTGQKVVLSSSNTMSISILPNVVYYLIRINSNTYRLAESENDAVQGNYIAFVTQGTGIYTIKSVLNNRILGSEVGEDAHVLTISELPSHKHNIDLSGIHTHTGYTDISGEHNHIYYTGKDDGSLLNYEGFRPPGDGTENNRELPTSFNGLHQHSFITDPDGLHSHNMQFTGDSNSHSNMQPTVFVGNMFIFAGNHTEYIKNFSMLKDYLIRWGFQLIDYVDLEIGGQPIDKHYGEWLDIWTQLSYTREKYEELLSMLNTSLFASEQHHLYDKTAKLYIPLQFWFNRNPGLYLPLIALQYHEVKINIQFNLKNIVNTACPKTSNIVKFNNFNYNQGSYDKTAYIEKIVDLKVYCDYIFLDTDERRNFAQNDHEYLVEQVQSSGIMKNTHQILELPLVLSHPCKLLVWRAQRNNPTFQDNPSGSPYSDKYFLGHSFDYSAIGGNSSEENPEFFENTDIIKYAKLVLNGVDRFKEREGTYFRVVQPNQYISNQSAGLSFFNNNYSRYATNFYLYNFGIKTDESQPSGTCNFSRIDNALLYLRVNPYSSTIQNSNKIHSYNYRYHAMNYNILKIKSGMAGLAYSN